MNYNVVLMDLPGTVHEFVRENADNSYTIVLNARLNNEKQKECYLHALSHIINADFEKDIPADEIEEISHKRG